MLCMHKRLPKNMIKRRTIYRGQFNLLTKYIEKSNSNNCLKKGREGSEEQAAHTKRLCFWVSQRIWHVFEIRFYHQIETRTRIQWRFGQKPLLGRWSSSPSINEQVRESQCVAVLFTRLCMFLCPLFFFNKSMHFFYFLFLHFNFLFSIWKLFEYIKDIKNWILLIPLTKDV